MRVNTRFQPRTTERIRYNYFVKREIISLAEPNDENPLTVLGNPRSRIDNPPVDVIAEFPGEHIMNHAERSALIVINKILDIFENKSRGLEIANHPRHFVEKRTLRLACKTVRPVERVLLRHSGDRKWLARKTGEQHIVFRNLRG